LKYLLAEGGISKFQFVEQDTQDEVFEASHSGSQAALGHAGLIFMEGHIAAIVQTGFEGSKTSHQFENPIFLTTKALSFDRAFVLWNNFALGQGVVDGTERVVDLLAESGHNDDHDDGDECENDRVLNETLAFFFGSE